MTSAVIHVVQWGFAGSVRDAGRLGRASLGAGRGGAVDRESLALANRLVGNEPAAAAIESSGALQLRITGGPVMVAMAGGAAAVDVTDGPPIGWGAPTVLPVGAHVRLGRVTDGTRLYLAVRGGIVALDDDTLSIGADPGSSAAIEQAPRRSAPDRIRLWPGPRLDWFDDDTWRTLTTTAFTVTAECDRVGMRLSGPALARIHHGELPSEGMVEGAVQVPPDGAPIVMLADHPVTGGYPVVAVVDPRDIGHLSQLPPGSTVRFAPGR